MAGPFFNYKLKENNLALVPEQDESIYYPLYKDKSNKKSNLNNNSILNYSGLGLTAAKQLYGVYDATNSKLDPADLNYDPRMFNDPYGIANSFVKQQSIYAPKTSGQKFANIGQNTLEGFMAGAQTGNIYAMIGGAAGGLATGIGQVLAEDSTYRTDLATRSRNNAISSDIYNIMANQGLSNISNANALAYNNNISACGGKLYASGGNINNIIGTQEMEDDNVNIINEGGTHEMNPYGGVPQGVDMEGIPNLVEEGEVVYTDADSGEKRVFSNRITPSQEDLTSVNLGGKLKKGTWAEIAQKIIDMFANRNDPFSLKTKNELLNRAYEGQENQKLREEAAQYGMTPEEYVAALQAEMAQEQAQMTSQEPSDEQVMQYAQANGIPPEEAYRLLQQQGMQSQPQPQMGGYDEAQIQQLADEYGVTPEEIMQLIAEEQGTQAALGGALEYGPSASYNPLMGYDNYLLQRSGVIPAQARTYASGGPEKKNNYDTLRYSLPEFNWLFSQVSESPNTSIAVTPPISVNIPPDYVNLPDVNNNYIPESGAETISRNPDIIPEGGFYVENPNTNYKWEPVKVTESPKTSTNPDRWSRFVNSLKIMNPLRLAGAFDAANALMFPEPLDTYYSDRLREMYNPLEYHQIGTPYTYKPYDQYYALNQANAARNANISNLRDTSLGSASLYNAGVAGTNYTYNDILSKLGMSAQEYNDKMKQYNTQANNSYASYEAQRRENTQKYNNQLFANTVGASYAEYQNSKDLRKAARDTNRNVLIENLRRLGQEESYRASIDSNPSLLYNTMNVYKNWLAENNLKDSEENKKKFAEEVTNG